MYYNNMFKERIILKRKNISFGYILRIYPHNIFQRKDMKIFLAIAKDTHIELFSIFIFFFQKFFVYLQQQMTNSGIT